MLFSEIKIDIFIVQRCSSCFSPSPTANQPPRAKNSALELRRRRLGVKSANSAPNEREKRGFTALPCAGSAEYLIYASVPRWKLTGGLRAVAFSRRARVQPWALMLVCGSEMCYQDHFLPDVPPCMSLHGFNAGPRERRLLSQPAFRAHGRWGGGGYKHVQLNLFRKGGPPPAADETGPGAPADGQTKNLVDLEAD